jgi:hypothetical protein
MTARPDQASAVHGLSALVGTRGSVGKLEPRYRSSRNAVRQGPFKTEARRALHRDGWTESLDKLAELVTEQQ